MISKLGSRILVEPKYVIREFPLIELDCPNSVGNIYTSRSAKKILEIMEERGKIPGELVDVIKSDGTYETKLENASHVVEHLFLEDNFIVAVIKFRTTGNGRDALKMFEEGMATLRPTIRGKILQETKEVIVNDVISVDLIPVTDKILQKEINWINLK